jgi:hypothetical protein
MIGFSDKKSLKNASHLTANVVNCSCLVNWTDEETSLLLITAHFFVPSGNRSGLIPIFIPRRERARDRAKKCHFPNQRD